MKKSKASTISIVLIVGGAIAYSVFTHQKAPVAEDYTYSDGSITIAQTVFAVEHAATSLKRYRGLSGQRSMCAQCAMVFSFAEASHQQFVMRDMHFAIDIIWLKDGRVVEIVEGASPKTPEKLLGGTELATHVVELPEGTLERLGVTIGTYVTIKID